MDATRKAIRSLLQEAQLDIRIEGPKDASDHVTHGRETLAWVAYGPEGVETPWRNNEIGWIQVSQNANGDGFYVGKVSVAPDQQRRGVSSALHDAVFAYLQERGESLHSGDLLSSRENQAYWAKLEQQGKAKKLPDELIPGAMIWDRHRYVRTA